MVPACAHPSPISSKFANYGFRIAKRPRLVFCGHIHTGQHVGVDFEGSRIYNVSRLDERYEIAYEPTWVDV